MAMTHSFEDLLGLFKMADPQPGKIPVAHWPCEFMRVHERGFMSLFLFTIFPSLFIRSAKLCVRVYGFLGTPLAQCQTVEICLVGIGKERGAGRAHVESANRLALHQTVRLALGLSMLIDETIVLGS